MARKKDIVQPSLFQLAKKRERGERDAYHILPTYKVGHSGYSHGCRCDGCRQGSSVYKVAHKKLTDEERQERKEAARQEVLSRRSSGLKECRKCKETKEIELFAIHSRNAAGMPVYGPECKMCKAEYMRHYNERAERRDGNKAKKRAMRLWSSRNKEKRKSYLLKMKYGISYDEYCSLLKSQGGVCAVCLKPDRVVDKRTGKTRNLAVDHCHKTGKVRGLLCSLCNPAIGLADDDPEILKRMVDYLGGTV